MNKTENDYITVWDPIRNKIILITKEDCKKIQKTFNELETECPNFEAKAKEQ